MTEIVWMDITSGLKQVGHVVVDGYLLPYIEVKRFKDDPSQDGLVAVSLDGRMEIDTTESEIKTWGYLLGNAMAVAAGYACLGATEKRPLFACQVHTD